MDLAGEVVRQVVASKFGEVPGQIAGAVVSSDKVQQYVAAAGSSARQAVKRGRDKIVDISRGSKSTRLEDQRRARQDRVNTRRKAGGGKRGPDNLREMEDYGDFVGEEDVDQLDGAGGSDNTNANNGGAGGAGGGQGQRGITHRPDLWGIPRDLTDIHTGVLKIDGLSNIIDFECKGTDTHYVFTGLLDTYCNQYSKLNQNITLLDSLAKSGKVHWQIVEAEYKLHFLAATRKKIITNGTNNLIQRDFCGVPLFIGKPRANRRYIIPLDKNALNSQVTLPQDMLTFPSKQKVSNEVPARLIDARGLSVGETFVMKTMCGLGKDLWLTYPFGEILIDSSGTSVRGPGVFSYNIENFGNNMESIPTDIVNSSATEYNTTVMYNANTPKKAWITKLNQMGGRTDVLAFFGPNIEGEESKMTFQYTVRVETKLLLRYKDKFADPLQHWHHDKLHQLSLPQLEIQTADTAPKVNYCASGTGAHPYNETPLTMSDGGGATTTTTPAARPPPRPVVRRQPPPPTTPRGRGDRTRELR
ncbi:hypothetical protein Pcinc_010398 [Petrolisthes cinctipes]|uniref:Uncharacterized protein n=1 Tax=Petrolisthes cinctipes TaxID=88211 RepID=A0AAE1KXG1_PETCI|nr:hypothetical protein Pcinc_010398 [Petrolisthes cinctipes]